MRGDVKLYAAVIGVALLAVIALGIWLGPLPPNKVRLATGQEGGAYAATGATLSRILARSGVTLELVPTSGSKDNLERLEKTGPDAVDIAIVESGIWDRKTDKGVASLGALFLEPVWLFARKIGTGLDIQRLAHHSVAVGAEGSGTRLLALTLLKENGLDSGGLTLSPLGGQEAGDALIAGKIDAAWLVGGLQSSWITRLLTEPGIELVSFDRAQAYERRHPYLAATVLSEGVIDPARNVPPRDVHLIAPAAQLAIRGDLHPALQELLLYATHWAFSHGDALSAPGAFPSSHLGDIPLSDEAQRYFDRGPSFLRRLLPYWAANLAERLLIFLIPVAGLLVPLFQAAPPLYNWQIRRRIYIWYKTLRQLEQQGLAAKTELDREEVRRKVDALLIDVGHIHVPLSYSDDLYRLRAHVRLVADLLAASFARGTREALIG